MKELYKTVFGSNLYGTNTEKSDKDYKIIVLPDIAPLLLGEKALSNSVYSTSGSNTKNNSDDVDIEYIPLQVFVRDFAKGQTYALEVAFSMFSNVESVVIEPSIVPFMQELIKRFLTNKTQAMIGYAISQSIRYGVKGSKLKSLLGVIEVLSEFDDDQSLKDVYGKINETKYVHFDGDDLVIHGKTYKPHVSVAEAIHRVQNAIDVYGSRSIAAMEHDSIDWKSVSHAVRISGMVNMLLNDGYFRFPLPEDETTLIKNIKAGNMSWAEVEVIIAERLDAVDNITPHRLLHDGVNKQELDEFLTKYLLAQYNINL